MINIRRGCFETNSSSMHSLVVVKNPKPYTKEELKLNCYRDDREYDLFWDDEDANFGRHPFQVLRTPKDKLRYYVAHELGNCEKFEKQEDIKAFISKQTNVPVKKIRLSTSNRWGSQKKRDYYGYIEHNDTGESPFEYLSRKNISFEDFILNPKYVVIVDGDEYQEFKKLFESNILNGDDFEDISSGADFWNDSYVSIYVNWLRPDFWKETTNEELLDDVNEFSKVLAFEIDKDSYEFYDVNRIKELCQEAKKINPNIKTLLCSTGLTKPLSKEEINKLDTSMFDEINISDEDYTGEEE